ncbi:50S ribosomal protein L20, partial [bacterium]|nr:50S ribosomal protein L20 [bacterium]
MPRVKRGTTHNKRRKNLLKKVKGFKFGRKNLLRLARTASIKAGANRYKDVRRKKRDFRRLWQIRINAFVRDFDLSYSRFIDKLKKNNIELDRKILADFSINNKKILSQIIEKI